MSTIIYILKLVPTKFSFLLVKGSIYLFSFPGANSTAPSMTAHLAEVTR